MEWVNVTPCNKISFDCSHLITMPQCLKPGLQTFLQEKQRIRPEDYFKKRLPGNMLCHISGLSGWFPSSSLLTRDQF